MMRAAGSRGAGTRCPASQGRLRARQARLRSDPLLGSTQPERPVGARPEPRTPVDRERPRPSRPRGARAIAVRSDGGRGVGRAPTGTHGLVICAKNVRDTIEGGVDTELSAADALRRRFAAAASWPWRWPGRGLHPRGAFQCPARLHRRLAEWISIRAYGAHSNGPPVRQLPPCGTGSCAGPSRSRWPQFWPAARPPRRRHDPRQCRSPQRFPQLGRRR